MLRITRTIPTDVADTVRFTLEGKIVGPWVAELRRVVEVEQTGVELDLSSVEFVSADGLALLRELESRDVVLRNAVDYVAELIGAGRSAAHPEAELLCRLRAGEGSAWEAVVRETSGRLLAVARRLLHDDEEARDAVQAGFVAAFRSIGRFQGGSRIATWLHRIVVNEALMKIRSRGRRREESIEDLLPRFDADGHRHREIEGKIPSVEEALPDPRLRERVRACVEKLPVSYRTVLLLRDIEELDTREVAGMLSLSENAVKVRLHRARQALRTLLARELEGVPHVAAARPRTQAARAQVS